MIKLRVMASAFLFKGDELLMMKRSVTKKLAPGMWASIGGHLEPHEINDPTSACLREIYEETGISESELLDFKLKYMTIRRAAEEIRIQYAFFGSTNKTELTKTSEGELHWINRSEVLNREMPSTPRFILERYFSSGDEDKDVLVGVLSADGDKPQVSWIPLQDWENSIA